MSQRYEIKETIGQGGLGSVYKAFDNQLQRDVAMKRVLTTGEGTPEEVKAAGDKLIAEAQTLSCLNHPNIVTVFDVGQDDDGGFVVMELLDGETLDETVERGVLTTEDFREVVFQTMEGLITAQAANVIHRDIKPTNIMLIWQASGRFQLKILDFGLAKFSKNPSVQTMDQDEAVMGSIFFMAPEQFERAELDARTDLYQMGCVYYNSLTGQYPFNGETAPQVMNAHLQHKVVPLEQLRPDLPPVLCQWVMWLINRDIESRPANAKEALKYFPKDLTTGPALPAQAAAPPAAQPAATNTPSVKIATPTGKAQAPANLVTAKTQTAMPVATPAVAAKPAVATAAPLATGTASPTTTTQSSIPATPAKKGMNPVIWVSVIGAILIAIVGTFAFTYKRGIAKRADRLTELHDSDSPSGTVKDVSMLVGFLTSDKVSRAEKGEAYRTLKKLQGSGIDDAILTELKEVPSSSVRKQLTTVISQRGYKPAMQPILRYARSSRDSKDKLLYLRAAQPLASTDDFASVLEGMKKAKDTAERNIYEDTAVSIIRSAPRPQMQIKELRSQLNSAPASEQRSLFRVLGLIGDAETLNELEKIFQGKELAKQQAAMSALLSWPNRSPINLAAKVIETGDKSLVKPTQRAYSALSTKPGPVDIAAVIADWERGFKLFESNPAERIRILQFSVNEFPHPKTIAMMEGWKNGPWKGQAKYENLVNKVVEAMKQRITELPAIDPGEPLKGNQARVYGQNAGMTAFSTAISSWSSPDTYFSWNFKSKQGGDFKVQVEQADTNSIPSDFIVYINGETLKGRSAKTSSYEESKPVTLDGTVKLQGGMVYNLTLVAGEKTQPRMMDVVSVSLVK